MVVCLQPLKVDAPGPKISLIVFSRLWLGLVKDRRWKLAHPFSGIPHLNHNVKHLAIDFPGCVAENIKSGIDEFDIAER